MSDDTGHEAMIHLQPEQIQALRPLWPQGPGPMIGLHVANTGHGACLADRFPDPRVVLSWTGGNYSLSGDASALEPGAVSEWIHGMIEASDDFEAVLRSSSKELAIWDRVVLVLDRPARMARVAEVEAELVRLGPEHAHHLHGLGVQTSWISETWSGPDGLARARVAWGAFVDGRLASVAAPFFVGDAYVDVGVVTEIRYRGRGLNPACTARVVEDVLAQGKKVSWTTSPDNQPSLRVAEKLGFERSRDDRLFLLGIGVPGVATRPDGDPDRA